MSTPFATLQSYIRTALGDYDPDAYTYSDDALIGQIRLTIMTINDSSISEAGTSQTFTTDLTVAQQARVIYRSARSIVAPMPDHFSYRTPLLSVTRERGAQSLRSYYDGIISQLEGKLSVMSASSELDEMIQATLRYSLAYARSLAKVPQYTNPKL